jgi:hypothetical protein
MIEGLTPSWPAGAMRSRGNGLGDESEEPERCRGRNSSLIHVSYGYGGAVYRFDKISHEKVGMWSKLAAKRRLG